MRDESDPEHKYCMLDYLIALLDYSNDFSWSAAQRHVDGVQNLGQSMSKESRVTKSRPCQFYNSGLCLHAQTHETRGCFISTCAHFSHPEAECRKNKQPKTCVKKL